MSKTKTFHGYPTEWVIPGKSFLEQFVPAFSYGGTVFPAADLNGFAPETSPIGIQRACSSHGEQSDYLPAIRFS